MKTFIAMYHVKGSPEDTWVYVGEFKTRELAKAALSAFRGRGYRTRILARKKA